MKKFTKIMAVVLALVLAVSCLAACSKTEGTTTTAGGATSEGETTKAPAAEGTAFKLGGIGPLTGDASIYGVAEMNGAKIAIDEINEKGEIKLELKTEDDQADGELSVNAYGKLLDWGMQIVLGPVTSGAAIAVAAETYKDRVFTFTPSGSSPDIIKDKDNAFQLCFSDPNQGVASADYMAEKMADAKIAVIYRNDDAYSQGIHDKFIDEAKTKKLEVVYEGTFTKDTQTDFSVQLTAAKNAGADTLFLPIYYQPASVILKQAKDMNYAPTVFGVDGMDGILTMENFDTSLAEGVMLLTPFSADAKDEATQSFVKKYKAAYNETPNQFAADGYDTVYAIAKVLQQAKCTPDMDAKEICEKIIAEMPNLKFDGITGKNMTWEATGEVSKLPQAIVIKDGVYVTPDAE